MVDEMGLQLKDDPSDQSNSTLSLLEVKKPVKRTTSKQKIEAVSKASLELDEQALIDQMNASNMVAADMMSREKDIKELNACLEEKKLLV